METRSRLRQAEEICRKCELQTHEEEPVNDESTDPELDNEEKLEGTVEDFKEHNSSSDDDIIAQEAEKMKQRQTLQSVLSSKESKFLYEKNHFKWSLDPPASRSVIPASLTYNPCGIEGKVWSPLIPEEILEIMVNYTNVKIEKRQPSFSTEPTFTHDIDLCELKAFVGLLYFSGLQGSTRNLQTLYGKLSSPIFRATMSRPRFEFLLSVICFDDKSPCQKRKETDKSTPIREYIGILLLATVNLISLLGKM